MSDVLLQAEKDGILLLTLNRPEKKNALNIALWEELYQAFSDAQTNDDINVVVITGAGDNFSSGVDLNDFSAAGGDHPFDKCARMIAAFDKPLVAAATGIAVGGGATMLFHADVLYVGESLRMRLPFVNLGLVPEFASSYVLQAAIGSRKAAELFYTAEWIDAEKAEQLGMVNGVFADDELLFNAMAKAEEIAQWPVNALRETKKTLKQAHKAGIDAAFAIEAAGMEKQAGSPENIEAVMAFIEKRTPDFKKLNS
ncbi:enoyl-CoA hydratase-related protein [Oceanicoccus sp. KOV_DT_Chl]|uniref:enoyl-CoA hydratase-related protein n=1 Tax=Oceanicoccus sp. KOV_DT_Chl TaxID=1904639 RepID=UPI000C7A1B9E|nr:enoyl-CoA hydratase-related protein [Oceanicoccus sp. KOV_DT_Chl]